MSELKFRDLSLRHHGVTKAVGDSYAEAATVCLDRHHTSGVEFAIADNENSSTGSASWETVDARSRAAWNNQIDATEQGACAIALAAIENCRGLVAVRRAETKTGADYYLDVPDSDPDDLETSTRLEVSGVDAGTAAEVKSRLGQKLRQAKKGSSNLPAIACVVGFAVLEIRAADTK
jgi:hypothetical protein